MTDLMRDFLWSSADKADKVNESAFSELGLKHLVDNGTAQSFTIDGHRVLSAPVFITPKLATEWLERWNNVGDAHNRSLSQYVIRRLAEQVTSGMWRLQPQNVIAFDDAGRLLDGQHRLSAVVRAEIGLWFRVEAGWPRSGFAVIDTGRKRVASQLLDGPWATRRASSARVLARVTGMIPEAELVTWDEVTARVVNPEQQLSWVAAWPELDVYAQAVDHVYRNTRINGTLHLAVLAQAARTEYVDRIEEWCEGLAGGVGLALNDPRLHLRNRWMRDYQALSSASRAMPYITIAKSWNAFVRGKGMTILKVGPADEIPVIAGYVSDAAAK